MKSREHVSLLYIILLLQSIYFIGTGIWPLIHISSFMYISGPKTDVWLVKTVGALIMVIGVTLFLARTRKKINLEVAVLAIGAAASLLAIDLIYVLNDTISPIYLFDAFAEGLFILLWLILIPLKPRRIRRY